MTLNNVALSQNKAQEDLQEYLKIQHQKNKIHNIWHAIKITENAKKKENMAHKPEKNQSIQYDPELAQMLAQVFKYIKITIKLLSTCLKH